MRYLFVDTTTDGNVIGGGHLFLPVLIEELAKRGHEVHLVIKAKSNEKLHSLLIHSGAIIHIRPWKKYAPVTDLVPYFVEWIKKLKPDFYINSTSAAIGWLVIPYLKEAGIPCFCIGHNNEDTYYNPVRHYKKYLTGAIGVSKEICAAFAGTCGMQAEKIAFIPYGVKAAKSIEIFKQKDPVRLIYVGRIEQNQKRIKDLVSIAQLLTQNEVSYTLDIIGDGPMMNYVTRNLENEISRKIVRVYGWLDKMEVEERLRKSEVFIMTSEFEGFSIALIEAMANGCCPIVTNIKAGNQEVIKNEENGYLIDIGQTKTFASVIQELSKKREKLNKNREMAYLTGKEYTVARMADKYVSCFEDFSKNQNEKDINISDYQVMQSCLSKYPIWLRRIKARLTKSNDV